MVFKFNDESKAIKPLAIIIETSINAKIHAMFIKQSISGIMSLDTLYYRDAKTLNRDVDNLHKKLNDFYKTEEEKKKKIGFVPDGVGDDDGHEPESEENEEQE